MKDIQGEILNGQKKKGERMNEKCIGKRQTENKREIEKAMQKQRKRQDKVKQSMEQRMEQRQKERDKVCVRVES